MVCRVFQKSAGAKKYPTTQSRTINPYALETAPTMLPSPMMQLAGDPTQFLFARNNYNMPNPELAELSRVLRAGGGSSTGVNLPIPSQFNYPVHGGGCVTISGLNLNLGGPPTQQVFRPAPPPMHPNVPPPMNLNQHDIITSSMISSTSGSFGQDQTSTGYGTDVNNVPNGPNNRSYMNVDHCMDLENYWPSY